jgi:acetylornithine deacetylase
MKGNASEAIGLLRRLISVESLSRQEEGTCAVLEDFLREKNVTFETAGNNVYAFNRCYDASLPTILLNSHHDTVKPNAGYTRDPFSPDIADGKLYGLGSNDAGGALVSLLAAFLHFYERKYLAYNLVFAASAEEEISGKNGIEMLLPHLGQIAFGIVGEPTEMQMAIAEKGLVVLDCVARGKAGHAAREEGVNAIYEALADIEWFRNFRFNRESEILGPVKMQVTVIEAGSQHNVVPDICRFTVDVRTTDALTNEEAVAIIRKHVASEVIPRSMRLRSSSIDPGHPVVKAGLALGRKTFGSSTLSDQALMPFPTLKMGPGHSARSHTADEFIYVHEIEEAVAIYIGLLEAVIAKTHLKQTEYEALAKGN